MKFIKDMQNNLNSIKYNTLFTYFSTPIGMYFVWIILHYASAHLYKMCCAPSGIWGFLLSPLMASTPYCTGLVWIMQHSVIKFMAIWTIVGSWVNITLNKTEIMKNTEIQTDTNEITTNEVDKKEE